MKKTILPLTLILLLSIFAYTVEKKYTFTEPQAVAIYNQLELQKQLLPNSDLPAKNATANIQMCDSLQKIIATQYKTLNDTTKTKK